MGGTDSRAWARTAPQRFPYLLRTCGDNDREGRAGDVRVPTSCRRSGLAVRASFGRLGPGRTGGALIQWYRCTFTSVNSFLARSKEIFFALREARKATTRTARLPGRAARGPNGRNSARRCWRPGPIALSSAPAAPMRADNRKPAWIRHRKGQAVPPPTASV